MFIQKKFAALALLAPLFTACVVTDDNDTDAGSGTDGTSATSPTTTAATDMTTSMTTASTDMTTSMTTTPTTTVATGDSTAGPETDTGTSGGYCEFTCAEPVDCCDPKDPMCADGIGTYPYNYGCEGGFCTFGGCSSDEECTLGGALPTWVCADFEGVGICQPGCAEDMDCEDQFLMGYTCTGGGGTYCEPPACTSDEDCAGKGATCNLDTGACEFPGCATDEDCFGFGVCDTTTGFCGCATDDDCAEGLGCVTE